MQIILKAFYAHCQSSPEKLLYKSDVAFLHSFIAKNKCFEFNELNKLLNSLHERATPCWTVNLNTLN